MVDINRMKLEIKDSPNWMNCMSKKLELQKTNSNSEFQYYEGNLFFHNDKSSPDFDEDRNLTIELTKTKACFKIKILGSLHNWYFGNTSNEDFSKSTFNKCIILLSDKLEVPKLHLSDATIMELTWKAKIGFRKEQRNFMNCILDHKTLKNKSTIGRNKIIFWGREKKLIITKRRNYQNIGNESTADFYYVHFQLKSTNVSNDKYLMENTRSPKEIIKNWDKIVDEWENQMNKIIIVNSFSPAISDYLDNSNMKKMSGYLVYVGIKHFGSDKFRQLMTSKMIPKKLYEYRKNYNEILERFESLDTPDYRIYFKIEIKKTADKLKK